MNKTIVKVFSLLLAITMLAVPVFAGGNQPNLPVGTEIIETETNEPVVQPRASSCDKCNVGDVVYLRTDYGPEYYIGTIPYCKITGGTDHQDKWYTQSVTKVYQCTFCDVQSTIDAEEKNIYKCS